jgi:asparagine synthase (glutamine-hydrolysing)
VGLAHRRLAIIDVSTAGEQPMANEDGSVWIAFNGEIYNHASLRPGLEAKGHRYRSRCDTETIVHLYEENGDRAVEDLHGMFAFAIWDKKRQELLLARDRLGIKPLYYAITDDALVFGSEIKSLFAAGCLRPVFNEEALPEYLATRFVSGGETFFRGVRKLLPGHVLTWSRKHGIRSVVLAAARAVDEARDRRSGGGLRPAAASRGRGQPPDERRAARRVPVGRLDSSALAA